MGFAADEIPMPPGNPDTLDSGVTQLKGIQEWTNDSYLITNGGNTAFFNAAWPDGNGSSAANGEAHRLVGFIKTGASETTSASKALGTYQGKLAAAHKKIAGWHKSWDAAETTYNTNKRITDDHSQSQSKQLYNELVQGYANDRDKVQNPIRKSYEEEMSHLRVAARTAAQALGSLFRESNGTSINGYLRANLPITANAEEAQAGINLANDIKRQQAKHPPNYKAIRNDLKESKSHQNSAAFTNAFIRTLGPDGVLQIPYDLQQSTNPNLSNDEKQRQNGGLLTLVADAAATYIGSGEAGSKFGAKVRADAKNPAKWWGVAGTPEGALIGHESLGLLLASGHSWPSDFLAGASDDIYKHEIALRKPTDPQDPFRTGKPDPWELMSGPGLLNDFPENAEHPADPLTNALTALGHNSAASLKFFVNDPDGNKLIYLIKVKHYADNGRALGKALDVATMRDPDNAANDATARKLANRVINTISLPNSRSETNQLPDNGYRQPPGMRIYTADILDRYIHSVDTALAGQNENETGAQQVAFNSADLRLVLKDTFTDRSAYNLVMGAAGRDIQQTMLHDAYVGSDYNSTSLRVEHDASWGGRAFGELYNERTQTLLDDADAADETNETRGDLVGLGVDIAAESAGEALPPLYGAVAGEFYDHVVKGALFPTDNAETTAEGRESGLDLADGAVIGGKSVQQQLDARLDYLHQHSTAPVNSPGQEHDDINTDFTNGFKNYGNQNTHGDERYRDEHNDTDGN